MKKVSKKEHGINRRMILQAMTEEQMHFEEEMTTIQTLIGLGMKAATEKIEWICPEQTERQVASFAPSKRSNTFIHLLRADFSPDQFDIVPS